MNSLERVLWGRAFADGFSLGSFGQSSGPVTMPACVLNCDGAPETSEEDARNFLKGETGDEQLDAFGPLTMNLIDVCNQGDPSKWDGDVSIPATSCCARQRPSSGDG